MVMVLGRVLDVLSGFCSRSNKELLLLNVDSDGKQSKVVLDSESHYELEREYGQSEKVLISGQPRQIHMSFQNEFIDEVCVYGDRVLFRN